MSKKKALIFDLDGTLLNSLIDIADAVNFVLDQHNFDTYEFDAYKNFIGNGIEVLARKALPQNLKEEEFQVLFSEIKASYQIRQNTKTAAYEGIISMLEEAQARGFKLAVLSNKPHEFVPPTIERYFKNIDFNYSFGSREGIEKKPKPDAVLELLNLMSLKAEECFFVGDTSTDIMTANNAKMDSIGVLWGFRDRKELEGANATYIIGHPKEILDLI